MLRLFAFLLAVPLTAQTVDPLMTALHRLQDAEKERKQFTYTEVDHTLNYQTNGKVRVDKTETFEKIYLGDFPYMKLVAFNGKPLEGKDAKNEQKRYEDALKLAKGYDRSQRAAKHEKFVNTSLPVDKLATQYDCQGSAGGLIEQKKVLAYKCQPKHDSPETWLFTVWIDTDTHDLRRLEATNPAATDTSEAGSTVLIDFMQQNGVPVTQHMHGKFRAKVKNGVIPVEFDQTLTNYHLFRSSARIVGMQEPGTSTDEKK